MQKPFNQRLKDAMSKANVNQDELADLIGVSQPMVSKYLEGRSRPRQEKIKQISEVLKCDYVWLSIGEDPQSDIDISKLSKSRLRELEKDEFSSLHVGSIHKNISEITTDMQVSFIEIEMLKKLIDEKERIIDSNNSLIKNYQERIDEYKKRIKELEDQIKDL